MSKISASTISEILLIYILAIYQEVICNISDGYITLKESSTMPIYGDITRGNMPYIRMVYHVEGKWQYIREVNHVDNK